MFRTGNRWRHTLVWFSAEALAHRCFVKMVFLEISQFQRKTPVPGIVVFLWILRSFQEHLLLQSNSGGCFCQCVFIKKFLKTEVDCDFSFFFQGNRTVHQVHHQFLAVLSLRCSFQKTFQKRSSCELQTFNQSAISIRNSFIWRFELCQCFFCNYFNIRLSFSSSVNL